MRKLVILFTILISVQVCAQDPNFSQFYNNPVYYNPAMTAINNGTTFRINGRNLWGPIPGRFNTFSSSIEAQTVYKMGLGLTAYSDVAGEALLRTQGCYLTYSYRPIDTKNFILQAGASGGFVQKNIDYSKLQFSDQFDETMGLIQPSAFVSTNRNSTTYVDFQTGLVMRFNGNISKSRKALKRYNATLGFAAHHLSQPTDAFLGSQNLPMRYIGHLQTNLLLNEVVLAPGIIVEKQNEFRTFSVGLNVINKPMMFGLWLRNRTVALNAKQYDSFIFTAGIQLPDRKTMSWRCMYNFDVTISRLKTSSFGTHEVCLILEFDNHVLFKGKASAKSIKRRYQCPKDFQVFQ